MSIYCEWLATLLKNARYDQSQWFFIKIRCLSTFSGNCDGEHHQKKPDITDSHATKTHDEFPKWWEFEGWKCERAKMLLSTSMLTFIATHCECQALGVCFFVKIHSHIENLILKKFIVSAYRIRSTSCHTCSFNPFRFPFLYVSVRWNSCKIQTQIYSSVATDFSACMHNLVQNWVELWTTFIHLIFNFKHNTDCRRNIHI